MINPPNFITVQDKIKHDGKICQPITDEKDDVLFCVEYTLYEADIYHISIVYFRGKVPMRWQIPATVYDVEEAISESKNFLRNELIPERSYNTIPKSELIQSLSRKINYDA